MRFSPTTHHENFNICATWSMLDNYKNIALLVDCRPTLFLLRFQNRKLNKLSCKWLRFVSHVFEINEDTIQYNTIH